MELSAAPIFALTRKEIHVTQRKKNVNPSHPYVFDSCLFCGLVADYHSCKASVDGGEQTPVGGTLARRVSHVL